MVIVFDGITACGGASPQMMNFRDPASGQTQGINLEWFDELAWDILHEEMRQAWCHPRILGLWLARHEELDLTRREAIEMEIRGLLATWYWRHDYSRQIVQ